MHHLINNGQLHHRKLKSVKEVKNVVGYHENIKLIFIGKWEIQRGRFFL